MENSVKNQRKYAKDEDEDDKSPSVSRKVIVIFNKKGFELLH
jgi:hypothetical protein